MANETTQITPMMELRLRALRSGLRHLRSRVRYIDYQTAESDCERLAEKLFLQIPRDELKEFTFAAIPRGGLIVLGLLAYQLDLTSRQLSDISDSDRPLIIIDDCALTGHRFLEFVRKRSAKRIVFATLYSHPALRESLLTRESRLELCLAANDLQDLAPSYFEHLDDYEAWRERLMRDGTSEAAWQGTLDLIGFAWNEPDHIFWNEVSKQIESGWRYIPPQRCYHNKIALGLPPKAAVVRAWQVPTSVVSGDFDSQIWLCKTDTEEIYTLDLVGSDMWRAIAGYGDVEAAIEYLQSKYDVEISRLLADLNKFLVDMGSSGLLESVDTRRSS